MKYLASIRNLHIFNIVIIVFQFSLRLQWHCRDCDIYLRAACKMQFSQMTLKYCIVISEICFCSVALQSAAPLLNRTGFGCSSGWSRRKKKNEKKIRQKSWKNSFNAFNLYSFFVYIPFIIISLLARHSHRGYFFFIINIGFTSWLCLRNALDFLRQDPEFNFFCYARRLKTQHWQMANWREWEAI